MRKIHFTTKMEEDSINIPMQFSILRLFILKDDIMWLNAIKSFHKTRKKHFFKPRYTTIRNLHVCRKMGKKEFMNIMWKRSRNLKSLQKYPLTKMDKLVVTLKTVI